MLRNNPETAEQVIDACFQINKLKDKLRTDENVKLINFLESHENLNNAIKNALNTGEIDLFKQRIKQAIKEIDDLIMLKDKQGKGIENIDDAIGILTSIKQHLKLALKAI